MGWWDTAVDTVTDFVSGDNSGGSAWEAASWLAPDEVEDTGSIFGSVGSALGSAWDWGTKNPAALGGIVGAGTAVANYMFQPDTAAETQADYLNKRRKEHNKGITKAAKRYKE